ncbi:MAG: hypothetical protein KGR69_00160 [Verrucomicrobia bacterium]|nr:hypothetical protein [Verrucomicrobiota bacterium]
MKWKAVIACLVTGSFPGDSPADEHSDAAVPRIEPALAILPTNHLKFYLHFPGAMERGEVFRHLRLVEIDSPGEEIGVVPEPFREVELWDETFTRLTLWFHPGRQKPGVNLNVEIGPILEAGKRYRLEVSRDWRDEEGRRLDWRMSHEFLAGPPDEVQPDPAKWTIATEGGLVRVTTDGPLDPESLRKRVVVRPAGERAALAVTVEADAGGFTMRRADGWPAGAYRLIVDPRLEDLAGNSVARPFNVDLEKGAVEEGHGVEVGFVVRE